MPFQVDFAIVGGGFTGLAAAAWLRHCAPAKVVAVFQRHRLGAGGSGRTGGIVLPETATGGLPGLGNVLDGFKATLNHLGVKYHNLWDGVYEIAHGSSSVDSPLKWEDTGPLGVMNEVPGGSIDPGSWLGGLASAVERLGAFLFENALVTGVHFEKPIRLELSKGEVCAEHVLFATNAFALELSGLKRAAKPKLTMALTTGPLNDSDLRAIGLLPSKPFYTVDLPYLWGRTFSGNRVIFGSGLVPVRDWRELDALNIYTGEPTRLLTSLENRVRGLHLALHDVEITHHWGGPILFPNSGRVFFHRHPLSPNATVLGGFAGQGVALSVYLGRWAVEALLGQKQLPAWDTKTGKGKSKH